jgi:hypothetical protein
MRGWFGLLAVGVMIGSASGCSGDSPSTTNGSSTLSSVTTAPLASAGFCSLATDAANGTFDFTNEASVRALTEDPSLTDRQRQLLTAAVADAVRQITSGSSYANDMLVAAVNEICGVKLTPVTMTQ